MSPVARVAAFATLLGALACGSTVTVEDDGDGVGGVDVPTGTTSSGTTSSGTTSSGTTSSGTGATGAGASGAGGSTSSSGSGAYGAGGSTSSSGTGASGAGGSTSSSGTGASGAGGSTSSSGTGASGAGGSTSSSSSGGGAPPNCPPFLDDCTQCASSNCPEVWCGCVNNPACLDLFQCNSNCNDDPVCEQQCLTIHQDGISAALLVSGCAGTTCSGFCDWGDSGFTPCEECIYEDCAGEMNACLAIPSCTALWTCLDDCPQYDLSCQQQCYLDYPSGVQPLEVALQCIVNLCDQPCT